MTSKSHAVLNAPSSVPGTALGPVGFRYFTPQSYLAYEGAPGTQPLGAIVHGDLVAPARPWPQIASRLHPISGTPCIELVTTCEAVTYGRDGDFEVASTGQLLFAAACLETKHAKSVASASEQIYAGLFRLLERLGCPHLLRTWNVLQDINLDLEGQENYRQFCLGRHEAMVQCGIDVSGGFPAASAVGARSGGLNVYALAARTPGVPVENPNQVSAYRYPARYSPRSPSFARGLVKTWGAANTLYLSGTASITGHESRHLGQIDAQAENALDNLESLIGAAERVSERHFPVSSDTAILKAYIREPAHYSQVRAHFEARFGANIPVVYLCADICRAELLCEFDGALSVAQPPARPMDPGYPRALQRDADAPPITGVQD